MFSNKLRSATSQNKQNRLSKSSQTKKRNQSHTKDESFVYNVFSGKYKLYETFWSKIKTVTSVLHFCMTKKIRNRIILTIPFHCEKNNTL